MILNKITYNYFLILFILIPVSIILGSTVSLINILLIDISFLFLIIMRGNYSFLKNDSVKYLLVLYLYLIFNSFISIDITSGIYRNLGFVRIIILFLAFNFFFNQNFFLDRLLKSWFIIISIVIFDVYFEYFNGVNLLGFPETREESISFGPRLVSFFKDEPIVGGFINGFYLILIGLLANKYHFKQKKIIFFTSMVLLIAIFITGERSNSIRAFFGLILFILFFKELSKNVKLTFLVISLLSIFVLLFNSQYLKLRYTTQIKTALSGNSQYIGLYKSGIKVFKNYPIFGVGNKNFRVETCKNFELEGISKNEEKYWCTTHPHQIYLEFLSEHGLIGSLILLFIFFKLIFSKIFRVFKDANYVQLGSMIYLLTIFLPLLPSGAFFNDYSLTIFVMNLGIFYGSNKNFNIFNSKLT